MENIAVVVFFERDLTSRLRDGKLTNNQLIKSISDLVGVKRYHYLIPEGMDLKVGEYIYAGWENLGLVEDIKENSIENMSEVNLAQKTLIAKVELGPILKKAEKLERKRYLKTQIDKMKASFEEFKFLQMISESDPEAKKLIEEYKELSQLTEK